MLVCTVVSAPASTSPRGGGGAAGAAPQPRHSPAWLSAGSAPADGAAQAARGAICQRGHASRMPRRRKQSQSGAPSQKEVVMATTARPQASTSRSSALKKAQHEARLGLLSPFIVLLGGAGAAVSGRRAAAGGRQPRGGAAARRGDCGAASEEARRGARFGAPTEAADVARRATRRCRAPLLAPCRCALMREAAIQLAVIHVTHRCSDPPPCAPPCRPPCAPASPPAGARDSSRTPADKRRSA